MNPIVALIIGIVVGAIDVLVLLLTIISIESTSPVDDNLRPLRLKRTIEIIILVVCVLLIIYGINPSAVSTPGKLFGLIWMAIKGFFMIIGYPFVWIFKGILFLARRIPYLFALLGGSIGALLAFRADSQYGVGRLRIVLGVLLVGLAVYGLAGTLGWL